ncbi:MAG: N-formylglutamate amidohydrolase [Polyangiaceae bacterium]|nr:N-formylglutamate amidohydrolase [Polyangiaceae bacterium]
MQTDGASPSPAPFEVVRALAPGPVVLEIPHAGVHLDACHLVPLRIPAQALEAGAPFADSDVGAALMWEGSERAGATRVVARLSRYVVDLNTEPRLPTDYEDKLPPGLGDRRVRSHAGVSWWEPRRTRAELAARYAEVLEPYHRAVASELERARALHGVSLLVSAHTYPDGGRAGTPDVVLGTRGAASAPAPLRDALARELAAEGLEVALEQPFPGGYALGRHAAADTFALQLELARRLVCLPGDPTRPVVDAGAVAALRPRLARALLGPATLELLRALAGTHGSATAP